jgi:hypothetical protein
MKHLLLFLLAHISWDSKTFAQCDPSAFVVTLSPGVTQSGAYFSMEAGIWPIDGRLGAMAGPLMYDERVPTEKGSEKLTQIDLLARVIYKLTHTGSDYPQVVSAFGTVRGLVGVSYRSYMSIGRSEMIAIEPVWVNRLGLGVNVLITMRL